MKHIIKILPMFIIFFALTLSGCGSNISSADTNSTNSDKTAEVSASASTSADTTAAISSGGLLVLTLEELSTYDGKNGNPAYIAVDGVIYDVTNVPEWTNGKHNGYTAGKDLTDEIKNKSPHGTSKLQGVTVVGKLAN